MFKRFAILLILLLPLSLLCNASWKRDGIIPKDKFSKFESKNREFNSIRDATKVNNQFYPILDVDMIQGRDSAAEDNKSYEGEGSGDHEMFQNRNMNEADYFYRHLKDDVYYESSGTNIKIKMYLKIFIYIMIVIYITQVIHIITLAMYFWSLACTLDFLHNDIDLTQI